MGCFACPTTHHQEAGRHAQARGHHATHGCTHCTGDAPCKAVCGDGGKGCAKVMAVRQGLVAARLAAVEAGKTCMQVGPIPTSRLHHNESAYRPSHLSMVVARCSWSAGTSTGTSALRAAEGGPGRRAARHSKAQCGGRWPDAGRGTGCEDSTHCRPWLAVLAAPPPCVQQGRWHPRPCDAGSPGS